MGELVKNGINGLTFEHRNVNSLADTIYESILMQQRISDTNIGKSVLEMLGD